MDATEHLLRLLRQFLMRLHLPVQELRCQLAVLEEVDIPRRQEVLGAESFRLRPGWSLVLVGVLVDFF